jgi:hypothetical protein
MGFLEDMTSSMISSACIGAGDGAFLGGGDKAAAQGLGDDSSDSRHSGLLSLLDSVDASAIDGAGHTGLFDRELLHESSGLDWDGMPDFGSGGDDAGGMTSVLSGLDSSAISDVMSQFASQYGGGSSQDSLAID